MNINFTLFSQAMAFAVFIWFTVKFVWPPLLRAIETRQKTIADGLAAGERGKHDLELASHRSADLVRDAKQRAADIITQAEKRAAEIVEEAKSSAKDEGGSYPRRRQGGGRTGGVPRQGKLTAAGGGAGGGRCLKNSTAGSGCKRPRGSACFHQGRAVSDG